MWKGTFEPEETGEGRRVYRLRWKPPDQDSTPDAPLSDEEIRGGLFIRYLIASGKLGEGRD